MLDFLDASPRHVPTSLKVQLLLGHPLAQAGALAALAGALICGYSAGRIDLSGSRFEQEDVAITRGRVLSVRDSGYSLRRGAGQVQEIRYTYSDPRGGRHQASAFTSKRVPQVGSSVEVELLRHEPETSRIRGTLRRPLDPSNAMVVIVPLVGFALLLQSSWGRTRTLALLERGELVEGWLESRNHQEAQPRQAAHYVLSYAFVDGSGVTRNFEARRADEGPFLEGDAVQVLHTPGNPSDAMALTDLPASVRTDEYGQLLPSPAGAVASLVLPLAALLGFFVSLGMLLLS